MFRVISDVLKTAAVAGVAVVAAGVVSPDTLAGRSDVCATDGTASCRLSDLRVLDPATVWETAVAVQDFSGEVAAAWGRLSTRLGTPARTEPV